MKKDQKISTLTKVLINKTHGGRKKSSKFWDADITLEKTNLKTKKREKPRSSKRKPINPLYGNVFRTFGIIFIIVFWVNFFLDRQETRKIEVTAIEKQGPQRQQSTPSPQKKRPATDFTIDRVSLTGKVFSWTDENGHLHYSNVNFPRDNPTLKVENEIKKQSSVTSISVKNGQIFIPVTFTNKGRKLTLSMVLDTGCSRTNVPYAMLNKLNVRYTKTTTSIVADGRKKYGRLAKVESIKVGPKQEFHFDVNGSQVAGSQNMGLLGLDFLHKHPFKIDFNRELIIWN